MQSPNYAVTPTVAAVVLSVGDTSRVAPINAGVLFTPPAAAGTSPPGAGVERIAVSPLGNIGATVLRLFRYDVANTAYHLYAEIPIPALAAANGVANAPALGAAALTLQAVDYPTLFPIAIPANWQLRATINDTQIDTEMKLNSLALSQTTAGAGNLSLNGSAVSAASAAAISASATQAGAAYLTLTSAPFAMPAPAQVTLTSAGNASAVNFTITGRLKDGTLTSETLAGPNANTVFSTKVYASILAITCSAAVGAATSVGYSTVAPFSIPAQLILSSLGNLSAINFTIMGTSTTGVVQTEVLAGPNANTVTSVKSYASITSIVASAAVATAVLVGNAALLSGLKAQAEGGGY